MKQIFHSIIIFLFGQRPLPVPKLPLLTSFPSKKPDILERTLSLLHKKEILDNIIILLFHQIPPLIPKLSLLASAPTEKPGMLTLQWPRGGGGALPQQVFPKFLNNLKELLLQTKFLAVALSLVHLSIKKFFRSNLPSWL